MDPRGIHRLANDIKHYAWGSRTAIPDLLGMPSPSPQPCAEIWMGAYPGSPSRVLLESGLAPLDAFIAERPEAVLGPRVVERFGPKLPFLFKVLAAAEPLSIQAHPNLEQAKEGFRRENEMGRSLDAKGRCYRDANHKPELLCALTPFMALDRFRPAAEVAREFAAIGAPQLEQARAMLERDAGEVGLRGAFRAVMELEGAALASVLGRAVDAASAARGPGWAWLKKLAEAHPGDVGALAPIFLNVVELAPGQAIYVAAGELHSYLQGTGVELMANSDNVLRGGLTSKHVDVPELLHTLEFESRAPEILTPQVVGEGEWRFGTPAEEFSLSRIEVVKGRVHRSAVDRNLEILLCTEGQGSLSARTGGSPLAFERGSVLLVSASADDYCIEGGATLFKATAGPR